MTALDVTAVYDTDYSSPNMEAETVTFNPGDTSATVTYTISTDTIIEATETFTLTLTLSGMTDTDMFAATTEPDNAIVSITDCTGKAVAQNFSFAGCLF